MVVVAVNPDLQRERCKTTFSVQKITYMLDGDGTGKQTERRRKLEKLIENDPTGVFSNDNNMYMHRTERHVRSLAKFVRIVELARKLNLGKEHNGELIFSQDFNTLLTSAADDFNISLHWVMFVPNIISLCDEQQQKQWLPLCRDWYMIGCYAQTELGHGSNIRALETTATFVPEAKGGDKGGSFIINSPTLTSTKFWPGTLGRTANHAMVIARLIDGDGIDRGIHNFLVPLRSMTNHTLLPGVQTGDIGPKIGYNVMDNGYAIFNNVKIPRRNMATRFAQVDEYGKYSTKKTNDAASKVAYITMMQVRAHICNVASIELAKACTIVIRYSAIRRQGFDNDAAIDEVTNQQPELQILDYKQQQHRIFPLLAASYCFHFTGKRLLQQLKDLENKLIYNKPMTKAEVTDIHASSSGLKSFTTTVSADGIEDCRKACGGHGFLQCSGLPELYTNYLQHPTVEGDNQMLPQQVIKVLLKLVDSVQNQKDLKDYIPCDSYILVSHLQSILHSQSSDRCEAQSQNDMLKIPIIVHAFGHRAARMLVNVSQQLEQNVTKDGMTHQDAWNESLIAMSRASRAYSQLLLIKNFIDGIQDELNKGVIGDEENKVLIELVQLFALYWMEREIGDFLEDGYLTEEQVKWCHNCVLYQLHIIRPNAVALIDARDFSNFRLKSTLGRYDGNVYTAIMESAKKDPLNNTDPGPGYDEHLKRLIVDGVGKYYYTTSRL